MVDLILQRYGRKGMFNFKALPDNGLISHNRMVFYIIERTGELMA